ncbi:O-antigen ligase family protein [Patescibacteria group bacterium]|nr:O-antigen ligase family protein [Patescibacteria group bacterium]
MKNPRKIVIFFFNFLLFSVPLYFRFVNEELFEFNKMILVYALTTIITFFWCIRMIQEKRLIFKKTPLDIPIFLFVISQLVSTIFSIHPRTSWLGYYSRFNGGLVSIMSYALLYYAFVSNIKKRDLFGILVSTFTSAILVSLYGILEHFGHSVSCLFAPGLKDFSVSCWKQDVQSRVFATFGQPNWLAAYAITILPLGISLAIQKRNDTGNKINETASKYQFFQKFFFGISSTLLFAVLIFTKSRSGLIGFAGGIFVFLIGVLVSFLKSKKIIDFKFTIALLSLIIIIAGIFGTMYTPSFSELSEKNKQAEIFNDTSISSTNLEELDQPIVNRLDLGGTDSGEIRKIVWKGGLQIWQRYPIIGSGVETFAYSYYLDRLREHNDVSEWDFLYNKAHNELINFLATTGIFGVATYLSIFVAFGIEVIKAVYKNKETGIVSVAILAGIVGLFISNFFGFSTVMVNTLMYILFGVFIIINQKETQTKQKSSEKNRVKISSPDQYFAITLLSIISIVILMRIYNYWNADRLFSQGKTYFSSGNYLVGIQKQVEATQKSPKEALYYDNLSNDYAKLAVELARTGQATAAAQLVNESIKASDLAIENNNRHLNFYKTRSRVFITLSQLDERFMVEAKKTIDKALELSPTDPKLVYTQAIIELSNGNTEIGQQLVEKTLALKPNYEKARWKASQLYESKDEIEKAIEQLQYIINYISPGNEEAKNKLSELEML